MTKPTALPVRAKRTTKRTSKPKDPVVETRGEEVHLTVGTRRYRIRGLDQNHSMGQLKVNILATRDDLVHLDTLDLYKARSRTSFIKATASELYTDNDIIKREKNRVTGGCVFARSHPGRMGNFRFVEHTVAVLARMSDFIV